MMNAYDKVYLEKARIALGRMLDFAVYDLDYKLPVFWDLFLSSGISDRFGSGDYTLLVGKSGVELTYEVLDSSGIMYEHIKPKYTMNRSAEYWTGWAIAYYQWQTSLSFKQIQDIIPIQDIVDLYNPYHEMDIRHFCDYINEQYKSINTETNLKKRRKLLGYSQRELAEMTGISIRTIQQYEQRQKNINKAQVDTLAMLAKALGCFIEDLMEKVA